MTANVTVLGGAAAGGNTGAGCSGLLIRTDSTSLVLDFGPGVLLELRKHVDFREIDGIVISHLHLDHTLDLGALRFALAYNPRKASAPIPLWMPPGGRAFLRTWGEAFADQGEEADFFNRTYDIAEYDPSGNVTVGEASITFFKTVHYRPCWAMRVALPGVSDFFFTADTGPAAHLQQFATGCGVVAAESGTVTGKGETFEQRGHLLPEEAGALAADAGATTLILTHLWEEYGFDVYASRAASTFSGEIVIGRPGLTVELPVISAPPA